MESGHPDQKENGIQFFLNINVPLKRVILKRKLNTVF
jgi:hypothetical protein